MTQPNEADIWKVLGGVHDPELPLSLVDLGIVYRVEVGEGGVVHLDLTFTSIGCPGMDMILEDVRAAVETVPGVTGVRVRIVWSPPWTKARLTSRGRRQLQAAGLSV